MTQLAPTLTLTEAERGRAARVDVLASQGHEGVAELLEMLADPSWTIRRSVVASLAALGDDAVGPLCELLATRRDNEARIAANVDALVASSGAVEEHLAPLAAGADPAMAADIAQILGRRRKAPSVPLLVGLTQHGDDNVAVAALEGLGRLGGRAAVDALVAAVRSKNFFRTFPAIDVLGRSGDPRAVPPLAELIDDPRYALEAARALGRTGDRAAIEHLVRLLARPGEASFHVAASALADLLARYERQYGESPAIQEALRAGATRTGANLVRRLAQALPGADATEQRAYCFLLGLLGSAEAVPALALLTDAPEPVGETAISALRQLGQVAHGHLVEALAEAGSGRRLALLPLMARGAAVTAVVACLTDPEPGVRVLACETLGRIGNPAAVRPLFELLSDPNLAVNQAAIGAIQSLGCRDAELLALQAARSPVASLRRSGIRIVAYFGYPSALPLLLEALSDADNRVREAAMQGLAFLEDPRATDALLAASRESSAKTRASAARALGHSSGGLRVVSYLVRALSDEDAWVRYYACQALGRLRAEHAAGPIVALLHDPAGQVRVAAIEALSHLESDAASDALSQAARDADPDLRRAALVGLGIGQRPASLPLLLEAATAPDASTRLVALSAVSVYQGPRIAQLLAAAARDPEENVRAAALTFLARQPGADATELIVSLLNGATAQQPILETLAFPAEGRVEGLVRALRSADDELAPHLTATLVRLRIPDAEQALLEVFGGPNVAARKAAASSLLALGTLRAMAALRGRALEDSDPGVRQICTLLLAG